MVEENKESKDQVSPKSKSTGRAVAMAMSPVKKAWGMVTRTASKAKCMVDKEQSNLEL